MKQTLYPGQVLEDHLVTGIELDTRLSIYTFRIQVGA
jgi:hypothetical protein